MAMMAMTMAHSKHPSIVKEVNSDQNIAVVKMPTVSVMMMMMIDLNMISSSWVEVTQRGSLVRCLDPSHLNNSRC